MDAQHRRLAAEIERDFGGDVLQMLTRTKPDPLASVGALDLTDAGLAKLVAELYGEGIRRVLDIGEWRAFDGQRWAGGEAAVKLIERRVLEVGRVLYDRAPGLDDGLAKQAARASMRVLSDAGVRAVVSRLAAVESIGTESEVFDTDGELLNVANGTLNLRTGELHPHRAADFITRIIETPYDTEAPAERWEKALREIFEPNPELPEYLGRAVGYAATGLMREHVFHLLIGTGRNGKSLFVEALAEALGEYSLAIGADTLARPHDLQRPRPDIALMRGRRFVFSQEANRGTPLDEALLKRLSGGDTISARVLHQNPITFKSTAKLFLSTNHAPEITGTETAIWRRMRLIPFRVSFAGREDVTLARKLEQERTGILRWIVDGARRYFEIALDAPEVVTEATDRYRRESDQLGRFADDCLEFFDGATVAASRLQAAYRNWCALSGEKEQRAQFVAEYLKSKGIEKRKGRLGATYYGISVRPGAEGGEHAEV
jgi:putative DNA primase/helicase